MTTEKNNDQRAFHAETVAEQEAAGAWIEREMTLVSPDINDREPITHELKCDPGPFQDILSGCKKSEVRRDDRDFRVGDRLNLLETVSTGAAMAAGATLEYTGGQDFKTITHIQRGYGLPDGIVVLSFDATLHSTFTTDPCNGMNCGCTDGVSHSPECMAETAATYAGGWFVKGRKKPEGARGTETQPTTGDAVTDEMIDAACDAVPGLFRVDAMRAIEAALGAASQPAPATGDGATDFSTLGAAVRAIQQAIQLIDAPDHPDKMATIRRVLRAAIVIAEDDAAPATGDEREFTAWLVSEMPAGTIIGDPAWWAPRILRAVQASAAHRRDADSENGYLRACFNEEKRRREQVEATLAAHRREDQRDAERWRAVKPFLRVYTDDFEERECMPPNIGTVLSVNEDDDFMPGRHETPDAWADEAIDAAMQRTAAPAHGENGALELGDAL